ncbi:hypothetical protein LVD17_18370 [Fulvivirga ulvae]|nr:hypothetical protein [Fulvivirga ulvae]UII30262.1 hypothetical protein LVD17_18370 [Fulvivirga ulvae]
MDGSLLIQIREMNFANEYLAMLRSYEIGEMYFLMEGTCPECLASKS